jgi:hypothetical protein
MLKCEVAKYEYILYSEAGSMTIWCKTPAMQIDR